MNKRIAWVVLLAGMFLSGAALALSSDKDKPVEIEADRVDVDDNTGVSTFRGHVVLIKGTIRIEADVLTLYRAGDDGLDKVVATGKPVTYRQRPDNKDKDIVARALTIEYHAQQDKVLLLKNAKVIQDRNTFSGDRIEYDIKRDQVLAKKSSSGDQRVKVTIQPKDQPSKDKGKK